MPPLPPAGSPVQTWLELLGRPDTTLRTLAIQALAAAHGAEPAVQRRLVQVLRRDGSVYVRVRAAQALAPWALCPAILTALAAALGHPKTHPELRAACEVALRPHGGQSAVIAAVGPFLAHASAVVRESAPNLLAAALHDAAVCAGLVAALADPNSRVAGAAVQALAPVAADPAILPALVAQVGHPWIAYQVAQVLLPLAHEPQLQQLLLPLLTHPYPAVRAGAGRILAAAGDEPAILATLAPLLPPHPDDHPNGARSSAIIGFLRLPVRFIKSAVYDILRHGSRELDSFAAAQPRNCQVQSGVG